MKRAQLTILLFLSLVASLSLGIYCLNDMENCQPLKKIQKVIPKKHQVQNTHLSKQPKEKQIMTSQQTYTLTYGSKTAPHHLINFFDIGCAHCATFFKETWPIILRHFVDTEKLRVTFSPYPIHSETVLFMTCTEKLISIEHQILFEIIMESDLSALPAVTVIKQCMEAFKKTVAPPSSKALKEALHLTQKHEFTALPMMFLDGKELSDAEQDNIVHFLEESFK